VSYGLLFAALAALLGYAALSGGVGSLLLWPALSFALVAAAYLGLGARVFGKRRDGTLAWECVAGLLPYLLFTWAVWHLSRWVRREPPFHRIAPGLLAGRRLLPREMPAEVRTVVDLTAEFAEPRAVRGTGSYLCLPMLDASVPTDGELRELLDRIGRSPEPVYVHCAEGHGRTGLVAAALLVRKGLANDAEEALAALRGIRPGVDLKPAQRALLERVCRAGGREQGRLA
jgi:protein-tyrosine phosphatase